MKHDICACCGKSEDSHHQFVALESPEGCTCNIFEWGNPYDIPAICGMYTPSHHQNEMCVNCEHDAACHLNTDVANRPRS